MLASLLSMACKAIAPTPAIFIHRWFVHLQFHSLSCGRFCTSCHGHQWTAMAWTMALTKQTNPYSFIFQNMSLERLRLWRDHFRLSGLVSGSGYTTTVPAVHRYAPWQCPRLDRSNSAFYEPGMTLIFMQRCLQSTSTAQSFFWVFTSCNLGKWKTIHMFFQACTIRNS